MSKRLTDNEIRERQINRIISKIKKFEKTYPQDVVKAACYKYNMAILERRNALKDIRLAEQNLAAANRKLK